MTREPSSNRKTSAVVQRERLGQGASPLPWGTEPGSGSVPPAPGSWPDPPGMEARCPLPNAALRMSSPVRPRRDPPGIFSYAFSYLPPWNYA